MDFKEQLRREAPKIGKPPSAAGHGSVGPQRGSGPPRRYEGEIKVPDRPSGGYFDDSQDCKPLRLYYVSKATLDPLVRKLATDKPSLSMSQLRRFYNYCAAVRQRLQNKQSTWCDELPNIVMLSAFAADASKRPQNPIPQSFRDFVDTNVEMIQTERDFMGGFMKHFEGLVGFASLHLRHR